MSRRNEVTPEGPSDGARPVTGSGPASSETASDRVRPRELAAVALAYAAVTFVHLFPLASSPATMWVRYPDTAAIVWTLAFVVRQVALDPWHLFDSNAFWPHSLSLGYSESLLPQAAQAAPMMWLGASPVLAHNLVLLATWPLCGVFLYLLARELGASRGGAFLGGLAYAFCAWRFEHIVQLQHVSTQWLPLALWALRRSIAGGRARDLVALFVAAVLQALSSGYYAVLLAPALGLPLLLAAADPASRRRVGRSALVLGLAALVTFVAYSPQREVQRRHGFSRPREQAVVWSAHWRSFLEPGTILSVPHLSRLHDVVREPEALFPGTLPLLLGLGGLGLVRRDASARFAAVLLAAGLLLALGPEIAVGPWTVPGPVEWLRQLPGVSGLRTPVRMAVLASLGLSLLAALAWTRIEPRLPRLALALAVGFVAWESLPGQLPPLLAPVPEPPPSATWLATAPRGPVLEIPWLEPEEAALYLYWSTVHWQPMVNGFGAYEPPGSRALAGIATLLPRSHACHRLSSEGIRYLVLHEPGLREGQRRRLNEEPWCDGLTVAFRWGESDGRVLPEGGGLVLELAPAPGGAKGR